MKSSLVLTILTILIMSCGKNNFTKFDTQETFIVTNKEEKMPVWVKGKGDANAILLVVHGGPGSDVLDFRNYQKGKGFKEIEKSYLVAYWQQRASGQSIGPDNKTYYTIDQYVEDCDRVVDELKTKYPNKKIVLFGHSWGGLLTSSYLSDATRRAKIAAWIDAAGVTNGTTLFQQTIDDINAEAEHRIAKNENTAYWQDIKAKLKENPLQANSLAYACLDKFGEVIIKVNNADFKYASRVGSSNTTLFSEIIKTNNSTQVVNFTIPTLILWGKYDFAVSKKQKEEIISKIGTTKLTTVEFKGSGHYMMFHEPNLFATSILKFMNSL